MSLRLYDTATRQIREFVPLRAGHVGIYHCGLTVQGPPHIGHIRKEVVFDVLRRWLEYTGHEVTVVANVTDIDDKILAKSDEAGRPWWAVAYANERALDDAYEILGCLLPAYQPRATGHVPEMVELMSELVERGHAYPAPDGAGDVYFDVRSWPSYGELSRQRIEDMEPAADADPRGKRDPRDFALWKAHKPEEPETASWPTPYGRGRPGWHLECSAMAAKYLGEEFDIHGGGLDLRFPHHENELAQSKAAGRAFARLWMHNAMLNLTGTKMSKSIGNTLLVSEVVKRVRPVELRYYLLAAHYRSVIEFSEESTGRRRRRVPAPGGLRSTRQRHRAGRRGVIGSSGVRGGHGRRPRGAASSGDCLRCCARGQRSAGRRGIGGPAGEPRRRARDARRPRSRPAGRTVVWQRDT